MRAASKVEDILGESVQLLLKDSFRSSCQRRTPPSFSAKRQAIRDSESTPHELGSLFHSRSPFGSPLLFGAGMAASPMLATKPCQLLVHIPNAHNLVDSAPSIRVAVAIGVVHVLVFLVHRRRWLRRHEIAWQRIHCSCHRALASRR